MSLTQSLSLTVSGNKPTPSKIRIQPTSARTTKYSYAGWQWRRRYTISNDSDNTLQNYPYAIDLGLTNGLVSGGKALSSGNDLRVTIGGLEQRRTLVDWNSGTLATLCWIILPDMGPGTVVTVEVIYGNASAGAPPELVYPYKPAFDITTAGANRSTNAKWIYNVARTAANAAKGAWYLDRGNAQPGSRDSGIPGAWATALTFDNAIDDVEQGRWTSYTDTLTYYMGRFDAKRARDGSLNGQDAMLADGVTIDVPIGISSVRAELEFINQTITTASSEPVGKLVILGRNADDADWAAFYTNSTAYATVTTIATATYTPAATMRQVAFAVWPYNGVSVPANATQGRYAEAAWVGTLEVNIASTNMTLTATMAETACYDMTSQVSIARDGIEAGVIRSTLQLGNWQQLTGPDVPRLMMALNEVLILDNDRRTSQIWNSGLTAKVEDVPVSCILALDTAVDVDGTQTTRAGLTPIELRPALNPITNPSFATNASGWTRASATSGLTAAALSRSTAQFATTPASGTVVVSANTAGAGAEAVDYTDLLLLAGARAISVAMDVRSTATTVVARPAIYWYDNSDAYISRSIGDDYTPTANTWYRRVAQGVAPANATKYRVAIVTFCRGAGSTGTVFADSIVVNGNEVEFADPDGGGSVTVTVEWTERYA